MLSIIIPIRNEYENLHNIERQFNDNLNEFAFEVILINDFSTDNTLKKAKEIFNNNKNFLVLDNSEKGLGGAISFGVKKARGEFICIIIIFI